MENSLWLHFSAILEFCPFDGAFKRHGKDNRIHHLLNIYYSADTVLFSYICHFILIRNPQSGLHQSHSHYIGEYTDF